MPLERMIPTSMYQPNRKIYTQVVKAIGRPQVRVAGTVPFDKEQNVVGIGGMKAQVVKILENIKVSLNAGGAKGDRLFCDTKPVSPTVEVPRLVHPD